jgi:hypothetical protein
MSTFAVARLGKDSVEQIKLLDAMQGSPSSPLRFTITCSQVPSEVAAGTYLFFCLGSDNNKGGQTDWVRGLRGFGKLISRKGGPAYNDAWTLLCEATIVFSRSLTKRDFLAKAPKAYFWFSNVPVIGLEAFSAQTIQLIKEENNQDVRALLYAIEECLPGVKQEFQQKYSDLDELLEYLPDNILDNESGGDVDDQTASPATESIEGLDERSSGNWGNYPIDSVLVRSEPRSAFEVLRRIESGQYKLDPDFQRGFVWPADKQSRLIESVLMRVPLPVFYLAEQPDGKVVVVDGLQRLTTLSRYVKNEFALAGLTNVSPDLNGKRFIELDPVYKNRIEDTPLILYLIDPRVPLGARLDIFERVNGGVPLTRQQMRNSLFNGKATRLLRDCAASIEFKTATAGSIKSITMRDRELINRFCAFKVLPIIEYKGDVDEYLAKALIHMNKMPDAGIEDLKQDFLKSMRLNIKVFKRHAFRKHTSASQGRSVINAALFEVMSVGLSRHSIASIEAKAPEIRRAFYGLMRNATFHSSISQGTSDPSKVRDRFRLFNNAINEVLE